MGDKFLDLCEAVFGTRNLYHIFDVRQNATAAESEFYFCESFDGKSVNIVIFIFTPCSQKRIS